MLESIPLPNPEVRWETLESGRKMVVYAKRRGLLTRLLGRVVPMADTGQVALDRMGTLVLEQMDGAKTVQDLISFVADEFKLSRKESEVSLLSYMETLGRRGVVGFQVAREGDKD